MLLFLSRRPQTAVGLGKPVHASALRGRATVRTAAERTRRREGGGKGSLLTPDGPCVFFDLRQHRSPLERTNLHVLGDWNLTPQCRVYGGKTDVIDHSLFRCPDTGEPLVLEGDSLVSSIGRRWPIVNGIPRFVTNDHYVASFSFEWNIHRATQLDSRTGGTSSESILQKKTGLTRDQVEGKLVLDAGAGAGRFTEVLARWGAYVVGVDLSYAVEAAYENCRALPNVLIAQADIGRLPFARASFDHVVSIGVLHHTPDTKAYFQKLVPFLKPGGNIFIWVYPNQGAYRRRAAWMPFTRRIPLEWYYSWCKCFVPLAVRLLDRPLMQWLALVFPFSHQGLGIENDILDTFDAYTPAFHWVHDPAEVVGWFKESGLVNIRTLPWDTAVCGQKPSGAGAAANELEPRA